jgi:hypothetical protein
VHASDGAAASRRNNWVIFAIALLVVTAAMRSELRPLRSSNQTVSIVEDVNDDGVGLRRIADVSGDALFVGDGLSLSPGTSTVVLLPLPPVRADADLVINLWAYKPPGLNSRFECSNDGTTFVEAASNVHSFGAPLPLEACDDRPVALRMSFAREANSGPDQILILDRIVVSSVTGRASAPGLVPLSVAWLLVAVAVFGTSVLQRSRLAVVMAAMATSLLVIAVHNWWPAGLVPGGRRVLHLSPTLLVAAIGVAALAIPRYLRGLRIDRATEMLVLAFLLVVALGPRWAELETQLVQSLSPDAETVGHIASQMQHPFDTSVREPLWPWLVRASTMLTGYAGAAARLFSMTTAMAWLTLAFVFARLYWRGPCRAAGVLALLAIHPGLIVSSAQAHRTELYGTCLLLVGIGALTPALRARTRGISLMAGACGVVLTQMAGVIPACAAVAWGVLRHRLSLTVATLVVAAAALASLPHGVYTHQRFGQAFYFQQTLVPVFYRNMEFMSVRKTGCDGCPSPEEMAASSFSGRPISMFDYLFRLHSVPEVATRIGQGYWRVFLDPGQLLSGVLGSGTKALYVLYLLGVGVALMTGARDLLIIPLASLNLLAFVVPVGIDPRLILHIAPFAAMLVVLGVTALLHVATLATSRRSRAEITSVATARTR